MGWFPFSRRERPGVQLEKDFAAWMQQELGYQKTEQRAYLKPHSGGRSYEFDVRGTLYKRKHRFLVLGSILGALICGILAFQRFDAGNGIAASKGPGIFAILFAGVAWSLAKRRVEVDTYVECKDWKNRVRRPIISQMVGRMQEFGDSKKREKGTETWMVVSSSGFTPPALEAAKAHGIQCFVREDRGFRALS